jgi:hypothetical protein
MLHIKHVSLYVQSESFSSHIHCICVTVAGRSTAVDQVLHGPERAALELDYIDRAFYM